MCIPLNLIDLTDKESTKMNLHKMLFALALGLLLTACGEKPSAHSTETGVDATADIAQAAADAAAAAAAADADMDVADVDSAEDEGN